MQSPGVGVLKTVAVKEAAVIPILRTLFRRKISRQPKLEFCRK